MYELIKQLIKRCFPNMVSIIKNRQFMSQVPVTVDVGSYELVIPSGHHLRQFIRDQPLRHTNVGITAAEYAVKYPQSVIVDIGANIGDTGAVIASNCTNDLVLVEPSDYYFKFLSINSKSWNNNAAWGLGAFFATPLPLGRATVGSSVNQSTGAPEFFICSIL